MILFALNFPVNLIKWQFLQITSLTNLFFLFQSKKRSRVSLLQCNNHPTLSLSTSAAMRRVTLSLQVTAMTVKVKAWWFNPSSTLVRLWKSSTWAQVRPKLPTWWISREVILPLKVKLQVDLPHLELHSKPLLHKSSSPRAWISKSKVVASNKFGIKLILISLVIKSANMLIQLQPILAKLQSSLCTIWSISKTNSNRRTNKPPQLSSKL